jgi:hypothetical protein
MGLASSGPSAPVSAKATDGVVYSLAQSFQCKSIKVISHFLRFHGVCRRAVENPEMSLEWSVPGIDMSSELEVQV